MEDYIYSLLRKSRVITDISSNSLFAVPNNQEFVYIHEYGVRESHLTNLSNRRSTKSRGNFSQDLKNVEKCMHKSLSDFVLEHVQVAFTTGFNDNARKYQGNIFFELPECNKWLQISQLLYNIYINEEVPNQQKSYFELEMRKPLSMFSSFSKSNCESAYPCAVNIYKEKLPKYYTKRTHESKLNTAIEYMGKTCRGPELNTFIQ